MQLTTAVLTGGERPVKTSSAADEGGGALHHVDNGVDAVVTGVEFDGGCEPVNPGDDYQEGQDRGQENHPASDYLAGL